MKSPWKTVWMQLRRHGLPFLSRKPFQWGESGEASWNITRQADVDGYAIYDRQLRGHKLAWADLDVRVFAGDVLRIPLPEIDT